MLPVQAMTAWRMHHLMTSDLPRKCSLRCAMALMHGDITGRTDKSIASHANILACTASACLHLITIEYIACTFHSDDCICGDHASAKNPLQSM